MKKLREKVKNAGQEHIFKFWDELSEKSQDKLIHQIQTIDFNLMNRLKDMYLNDDEEKLFSSELQPIDIIPIPTTDSQKEEAERAKLVGEKLLTDGKVAALLVAGGQGTRLGFNGPKGKYVVGPISQKSLFNMHADKILAMSRKYKTSIPWFIMTSEVNHKETVQYFDENEYFGLEPGNVYFFVQKNKSNHLQFR